MVTGLPLSQTNLLSGLQNNDSILAIILIYCLETEIYVVKSIFKYQYLPPY